MGVGPEEIRRIVLGIGKLRQPWGMPSLLVNSLTLVNPGERLSVVVNPARVIVYIASFPSHSLWSELVTATTWSRR